jgi:hypothetical protein
MCERRQLISGAPKLWSMSRDGTQTVYRHGGCRFETSFEISCVRTVLLSTFAGRTMGRLSKARGTSPETTTRRPALVYVFVRSEDRGHAGDGVRDVRHDTEVSLSFQTFQTTTKRANKILLQPVPKGQHNTTQHTTQIKTTQLDTDNTSQDNRTRTHARTHASKAQ